MKGVVGRVAGITFYKSGNRTMARESVTDRTDSATREQMLQRVMLPNIVHFWHVFREMPFTFWEKDSAGLSDYNNFVKYNLSKGALPLTKQESDNGDAYLWPYLISKGTLSSTNDFDLVRGAEFGEWTIMLGVRCLESDIIEDMPLSWLAEKILSANPWYLPGDVLNIIVFKEYTDDALGRSSIIPYYVSIPLDPDDQTPLGDFNISNIWEDQRYSYVFWDPETIFDGAVCFVTRKTKSGTLVSSSRLQLTNHASFYNGYTDEYLEQCLQSYEVQDDYLLNPDTDETGYDNMIQTNLECMSPCGLTPRDVLVPDPLEVFFEKYSSCEEWQKGGSYFSIRVSNYDMFFSLVITSSAKESMTFKRGSQVAFRQYSNFAILTFGRSASQSFQGLTIASIKVTDRNGNAVTIVPPTATEPSKVILSHEDIQQDDSTV